MRTQEPQNTVDAGSRRVSNIINECHYFASSHKTINLVLNVFIWVIYFVSAALPTLSDYLKSSKSPIMYIVYIIFTGSPQVPGNEEIIIIVWLYFIISLMLIILFIALLISITSNEVSLPVLKKYFAILVLYIIPILSQIFGKTFTASLAYLSFQNNRGPFYASILGELCLIFYSAFIFLQNSTTAYKIPHIYFQRNTMSSLIVNFALLIIQHIVLFLENPQKVLFVIFAIFCFGLVVYIFIYLPYSCRSVNIVSCFYLLFCAGCAIARSFLQLATISGVLIIFGISLAATALLFIFRHIFELSRGSLYMLLSGHNVDANEEIMELDFHAISHKDLFTIGRAIDNLNDEVIDKLIKTLDEISLFTNEEHIFKYSFNSIVVRKRTGVLNEVQHFINEQMEMIDNRKNDFWRSLWLSDFESLPKISADIGRMKYFLTQYVNYESKMNPGLFIEEKYMPIKRKCTENCPFFNFIIVFIFLISLYFNIAIISCYKKSADNQGQFFEFRKFISNFTMMQSELWYISGRANLSDYYRNTVTLLNTFKADPVYYSSIHKMFRTVFNNETLENQMNDYMSLALEANITGEFSDELKTKTIFLTIDTALQPPYNFFKTQFSNSIKNHITVWEFLLIFSFVVLVIVFFVSIVQFSKQLHKCFENFRLFSKQKIANLADIDTKELQCAAIPGKQSFIEWSASSDLIQSFVVTFVSFIVFFLLGLALYHDTIDADEKRSLNLEFFQRMDLMMMWLSAEVFQNYSIGDDNEYSSIAYCDRHMDYLMRESEAQDFVSLLSPDVISLIASYVMGASHYFPLYPLDQIKGAFDQMINSETPIRNMTNIFYINWSSFFLLSIFFFVFLMFIQSLINSLLNAANGERESLQDEFLTQTGTPETHDKIVSFDPNDLPFFYLEATADKKITFTTRIASNELQATKGQEFSTSHFGIAAGTEIARTLARVKEQPSSEPIQIKCLDGSYIFIMPAYGGPAMKTMKSFSVFRLPYGLAIETSDNDRPNRFYQLFPMVISQEKPFPQLVQINAVPFLVILVRLTGLNKWALKANQKVVEEFYKSIIKETDNICNSENKFMRVYIRDDMILFMTNPDIPIQGRWTFINNCADFGRAVRKAVKAIAAKYGNDVFASVVFARGEKQMMYVGNSTCTQADFLPDTLSLDFLEDAIKMFNIDAVGFAVMHRPNLRIPNTTLVGMYMSSTGVSTDLFLVT